MGYFHVAIDGPVGVGKSTVARLTARLTGFLYVDTGAMYRAVAHYAMRNGINISDAEAVCGMLDEINIGIKADGEEVQLVYLNGEDITELIRTSEVSMGASAVAAYRCVRAKLVEQQRLLAENRSIVMDGRDIGTQVLPDAEIKVYLDAPADIRASRRYFELLQKDVPADFETVKKELIMRDYDDANRAESPLAVAADAVTIDTGSMRAEEVAALIVGIIKERGGLS